MTEEELEELYRELDTTKAAAARAIGMTTAVTMFLSRLLPCLGLPERDRLYLKRILNKDIEECQQIAARTPQAETAEAKIAEAQLLITLRSALG